MRCKHIANIKLKQMPKVSIIVPCYNEEATIHILLKAIRDQDYPLSEIEVVIADGFSTDQTREKIEEFKKQHTELAIKVIDNPKRIIPAGLNQALQASSGDFVIRLDAHSVPSADYVSRCVGQLSQGVAENVGGVWDIRPRQDRWVARSIAAATTHPIGVGDARYRYSIKAEYVDTVPFGSFKRELFDRIGFFNEELLTNEDYEFNARIRKNDGRIWLDPQIKSIYFARSDYLSLFRQYWRYGYWKLRMLQLYPQTLRWRQALPPLFVLGLAGSLLLSPFWSSARIITGVILAVYIIALSFAAVPFAVKKKDFLLVLGIPISIAIMHIGWGLGFLWSMVKSLIRGG